MRWDDLKDGEWTIRVDQPEKGTAGKLKLPPMALELIEQQLRIAGNLYVFAGRGKTAFDSFTNARHSWMRNFREHVQQNSRLPLSRASIIRRK